MQLSTADKAVGVYRYSKLQTRVNVRGVGCCAGRAPSACRAGKHGTGWAARRRRCTPRSRKCSCGERVKAVEREARAVAYAFSLGSATLHAVYLSSSLDESAT